MKNFKLAILLTVLFVQLGCSSGITYDHSPFELPAGVVEMSFAATADMRDYTGKDMRYFRGACQRIASGGSGNFMVSPGDIDPPDRVYSDIQSYIGINYPWYPVVGNHEAETDSDMEWLRAFNPNGNTLPNIVNSGPANGVETNYSFDYEDVHIVVINEYYDGLSDTGTDGDVTDSLNNWLVNDLSTTTKPVKFVIGHEPAYPQPDEATGRLRHEDDSLNAHGVNRDRFWQALVDHGVTAYICGHTHNFSVYQTDGVWQIDVGHARGYGDTGSPSTFVMFYVMQDLSVWCYPYRLNLETHNYELGIPRKIRG
jgi:predicted phosphodiesterase